MRKNVAALLAACSLGVLGACGGSEDSNNPPSDTTRSSPSDAQPRAGSPTVIGNQPMLGTIGAQPVQDTPVADLPEHAGHTPIVATTPQPGQPAPAPTPAPSRFSREWVVSATGSDTGEGSAAQPLRSLAKAISLAGPGELIRVLPGTYTERLVIGASARAGTENAPITIQGEGKPRLVPGAGAGALVQVSRPHWVVDGFELDLQRKPFYGVTFQGDVQGSVLANSELHDGTLGAAITTYDKATGAIIENNHIHGFVKAGGNQDSHGVVVQPTSRDITVRNNDIHDNSGDSVQCLGPGKEEIYVCRKRM